MNVVLGGLWDSRWDLDCARGDQRQYEMNIRLWMEIQKTASVLRCRMNAVVDEWVIGAGLWERHRHQRRDFWLLREQQWERGQMRGREMVEL